MKKKDKVKIVQKYLDKHKNGQTYGLFIEKLSLKYEEAIETWMVHAEFRKAGTTEFVLESPNGSKKIFEISIKKDTFDVEEK